MLPINYWMLSFALFLFCHDEIKFIYRFINTLEWDVSITLGDEEFTTVNKSYGVSDYRILPRGR